MPTATLKSLADKAGVSLSKAEEKWAEAKAITSKEKSEDDPNYWGLVVTITKRKLGLSEMSIEDRINGFLNESEDGVPLNEEDSKARRAAVDWLKKLTTLSREADAISKMAKDEGYKNLAFIMSKGNAYYTLNELYGDILKNMNKDGLKTY